MTGDVQEEVTGADQDPTPSGARSLTVRLPSSAVLARMIAGAIVVLLVAAVVVESVRLHDADNRGLSSRERTVIQVATQYAVQFATYNYRSLDQDFALTESHAVEPFLSTYRSETSQIRPTLLRFKSSSTGTVLGAGIASLTSSSAVVDLFLDQTISNSASAQPRVDTERVKMTLVRRGGRWLISQVLLP